MMHMICSSNLDMLWQGEGLKAKGGECGHDFFVGNRHEVRVDRVGRVWLVRAPVSDPVVRKGIGGILGVGVLRDGGRFIMGVGPFVERTRFPGVDGSADPFVEGVLVDGIAPISRL